MAAWAKVKERASEPSSSSPSYTSPVDTADSIELFRGCLVFSEYLLNSKTRESQDTRLLMADKTLVRPYTV